MAEQTHGTGIEWTHVPGYKGGRCTADVQSVADFRNLLTKNWDHHDPWHINRVVDEVFAYALMCRTKVDSPPGAFRDFAARTCKMTRNDRRLWIFNEDPNDTEDDMAERRAACEALHDLIMEGV